MKMNSDELGALLGMKNPLWALVKKQGVSVHNDVADLFWSIPLDYPKVDHKLVTMHPTMDDKELHSKLSACGEDMERLLTEVDSWQREHILKALSEGAPEKFWMIFPTVLGVYISSGMLAVKVRKVLDWAESILSDSDGLKYTEKAGICAALMPSLPDQLVSIVSHLTNIAEDKLLETELHIEESLAKTNNGNSLSAKAAAEFIKTAFSAAENREISLAAMAVFVWRRATYKVIEIKANQDMVASHPIMAILSDMMDTIGRSGVPTPCTPEEQPDDKHTAEAPPSEALN